VRASSRRNFSPACITASAFPASTAFIAAIASFGVLGHDAAVEIDRERRVAVGGETIGPVLDVVVEPVPLVDHDDRGRSRARRLRQREVALRAA
jgi:hypothetical protein